MDKNFLAFAAYLMEDAEGPRSDSDIDPGKLTIWGFAASRRKSLGLSDHMTKQEAIDALHQHYWLPLGCDKLTPVVGWLYCDVKFNQGTNSSNKVMQAAVGAAIDGKWGPASKRAFSNWREYKTPAQFMTDYISQRQKHYVERTRYLLTVKYKDDLSKHDRIWTQQRGWLNRLGKLQLALFMAGHIKPVLSKNEQHAATAAGALALPSVAVVVEAVTQSSTGTFGDMLTTAAIDVHPLAGAVLPVVGGFIGRALARLRGR